MTSPSELLPSDRMALGQQVLISACLHRRHDSASLKPRKAWQRIPLGKPKYGILVGIRTLSDGNLIWDEDCGYLYEATSHFRAAIVSTSLRAKPDFVRMEDLQKVTA